MLLASNNSIPCLQDSASVIMEAHFFLFALFSFLLFVLMVFKSGKRWKGGIPAAKLPPGPPKLPVIGNMHRVVGPLTHHTLRDLARKYGALMHLQLGEVSAIVVSSPEMAKAAMQTYDINFATRPLILASKINAYNASTISFAPLGDYWRQMRKTCTMELLSVKRVKSFQWLREEEVANLIKTISASEGSIINLTERIFSWTYGITSRAAFGKRSKEDQEGFESAVIEGGRLATGFSLSDMFPSFKWLHWMSGNRVKLEKVHHKTDRILQKIVNDHRERKTGRREIGGETEEDLVDVLLKFQEQGELGFQLKDDHIKAVILDIFSAGSETSATALDWAMSELVKNPRLMKKAQAEVRQAFEGKESIVEEEVQQLKFLKSVVKEALRLHPSAPLLLPRECRESCVINGYEIPEKTKCIVNAWAVGRDPDHWIEADKFHPERFMDAPVDHIDAEFGYVPFGAGRRGCPGILFGVTNVEVPLAHMLYHFDWKLPGGMKGEDLDMTEAFSLTARRREDLRLIPTPYNGIRV